MAPLLIFVAQYCGDIHGELHQERGLVVISEFLNMECNSRNDERSAYESRQVVLMH